MRNVLTAYRVLATVVGVSIIVLVLVGLPLDKLHTLSPGVFPPGSTGQKIGSGPTVPTNADPTYANGDVFFKV